jgi:hypothetical protein
MDHLRILPASDGRVSLGPEGNLPKATLDDAILER